MRTRFLATFFTVLFFVSHACFAIASPVDQLQGVANRMVTQLEQNKSQLKNTKVIRRIVNQVLLPSVDLDRMSASVVGRYWQTAIPAQREQFKKDFAYLVTTTYSAAFASYDDDRVQFYPLRESYENRDVMVLRSVIIRRNGQRIPIGYNVVRSGNQWKVYDFSIEHVSMVQSYRAQFENVLANGGMSALLARLQQHNQRTR